MTPETTADALVIFTPSGKRGRFALGTPVLTAALYDRFSSRAEGEFAHRALSAMRHQFGGHLEKPAG